MIAATYTIVMALLALYGVHRSWLVYLYFKHRRAHDAPAARFAGEDRPVVTVQLPLYNEMYVAERLLMAVAAIRWPKDRLEIQVLDDSTDETVEIVRAKVAELRARGLDVHHLHRSERTGYKAGALANGLRLARGELFLVFDADFVPGPEILEATVDFFTDPKIGMVQARWGHVNRGFSGLTETQALLLDAHFVIEHGARCRAGRFWNFSGTAGVWRRAAIDGAGGWTHDTLTEDMDLSYRAQLAGWTFRFLPDVIVPAELPVEMNAFKSQQFRWAKGQMQVARKLLPAVLRAELPWRVKIEACFHLTNNIAYLLLLVLCALLLPNLFVSHRDHARELLFVDLPFFLGTTVSIAGFYLVAQRQIRRGVWSTLKRIPWLMAVCTGMCVNQARAVVEALVGHDSAFVRTPKHGVRTSREPWRQKKYRGVRSLVPFVELGFAAYYAVAIVLAIRLGDFLSLPFLLIFGAGFAYVGALSLRQTR